MNSCGEVEVVVYISILRDFCVLYFFVCKSYVQLMEEGNLEMFFWVIYYCQNKYDDGFCCYGFVGFEIVCLGQVDELFLNQMKYGLVWVFFEIWDVNELLYNNIKGIFIFLFGDF